MGMTPKQYSVLAHIGNQAPSRLRDIVHVHSGNMFCRIKHRCTVDKLYPDRGSLVATVFGIYLKGNLAFLERELEGGGE